MKTFFAFFAAATFALCAPAGAQVVSKVVVPLTLSASTVGTSATAAITSQAFAFNVDSGFAVVPNFQLSSTGTSNVTFYFQVSLDGTTWTTVTPFSYAVAATGTTPVIGFYNFPPRISGNAADNIAWVRLSAVQNGNTGPTVTINSITITTDNYR